MDFPVNRKTLDLMNELDRIALKHGGHFYLAKDSRMQRDIFLSSEKRVGDYLKYRQDEGASAVYHSAQSERLGL